MKPRKGKLECSVVREQYGHAANYKEWIFILDVDFFSGNVVYAWMLGTYISPAQKRDQIHSYMVSREETF